MPSVLEQEGEQEKAYILFWELGHKERECGTDNDRYLYLCVFIIDYFSSGVILCV